MTQEEINILMQPTQQKFVKLEIYDINNNFLDSIEANLIGGTLSIDSTSSSIRRSLSSLNFVINDPKYIPGYNGYFWINTKVRIAVGIKSIFTKKIIYFHMGWYLFDKPDVKKSQTSYEISIAGMDYMGLLNGTRGGYLSNAVKTEKPVGEPISQAIRNTLTDNGETNFMVDDICDSSGNILTIPYVLDCSNSDSVQTMIDKLATLYDNWEYFYSVGTETSQPMFIYQAIKDKTSDSIAWDFSVNNMIIDIDNQPNFNNPLNDVWIYGTYTDAYGQAFCHIQNNNILSPFSITNAEKTLTYSETVTTYTTNAECLAHAEKVLWTRSYLAEAVTITCVPIYNLDVNTVILLNRPDLNLVGKFLVTKISIDLKKDGIQTLNCSRLYVYQSDATTY